MFSNAFFTYKPKPLQRTLHLSGIWFSWCSPRRLTMATVLHSSSPRPLTLKIMEKYGSSLTSWRIEQATFRCDPSNIWPSESPTSTRSKKQDENTPLLLRSDDGAQWSVSDARILATTASRNGSKLVREHFEVGISLVVVFSDIETETKRRPIYIPCACSRVGPPF